MSKYYLGIEGEQSGPFTEEQIIVKIRQGSVPLDALVWYEGLPDWKSLSNIDAFRAVLQDPAGDPAAKASTEEKKPRESLESVISPHSGARTTLARRPSTFATKDADIAPIFGANDSSLTETPFVRFRVIFISSGLIALAIVVGALLFLKIGTTVNAKKLTRVNIKSEKVSARVTALKEAEASLDVDPDQSIAKLMELITSNATDQVGVRAAEVIAIYYRRKQKPQEAADVLMKVKQYELAANLYMTEPVNLQKADEAITALLETERGPKRKDLLIRHIAILLGAGGNHKKAMASIVKLSEEFPNQPHPYGYYLKPPDQRIADVFSRISFYYVNALMSAIATQLPTVNLVGRPRIEVRKNQNKYRIVGEYHGEVMFNHDRAPGIHLVYWLNDEQWTLVETNLTKERAKWAATSKATLVTATMDSETILQLLETRFASEFPKQNLYDPVPLRTNASPEQK